MDKSKNPPSRNKVGDASNIVADKQLREAIAKALGLQKGVLPEVKKDAPANQHYYREHEVFDYDYEQVVSTDYSNAEKDINNILALFHTYGNRERTGELNSLKTKKVKGAELVEMKWIDNRIAELNREVES